VKAHSGALPLLVCALRDAASVASLAPSDWDLLVRQARKADLLPALAARLSKVRSLVVPAAAQAHLDASLVLAHAQRSEVLRELANVRRALGSLEVEPILLKGAAYVAADLPPAHGRLFNDIDLLLPRPLLAHAEAELMRHGWATTHHSPYDQRYYREWMHELPPLRHIHRQTVLDVHHAILPPTARSKPDSALLIQESVPAALCEGFRVLGATDRVLHSASHLVHNEEASHMLRDLVDIDLLLRDGAVQPGFWSALKTRATQLDLARPLHYVLRQCATLLATPVPPEVLHGTVHRGYAGLRDRLMDSMWQRALLSCHRTMATRATPLALGFVYVRAHWLRMPPGLLIRHLTVKALGLNRTMQ
jgi:hypothetical protein